MNDRIMDKFKQLIRSALTILFILFMLLETLARPLEVKADTPTPYPTDTGYSGYVCFTYTSIYFNTYYRGILGDPYPSDGTTGVFSHNGYLDYYEFRTSGTWGTNPTGATVRLRTGTNINHLITPSSGWNQISYNDSDNITFWAGSSTFDGIRMCHKENEFSQNYTSTASLTPSLTPTVTHSLTPSLTPSASLTPSVTLTPSQTFTPSITPTINNSTDHWFTRTIDPLFQGNTDPNSPPYEGILGQTDLHCGEDAHLYAYYVYNSSTGTNAYIWGDLTRTAWSQGLWQSYSAFVYKEADFMNGVRSYDNNTTAMAFFHTYFPSVSSANFTFQSDRPAPWTHEINPEMSYNVERGGGGSSVPYSASVKLLCYGKEDPTPHLWGACENKAMARTYDLITQGTLDSGSLEAYDLVDSDTSKVDRIDFTYTIDLGGALMDEVTIGQLIINMGGDFGPNYPQDYNLQGTPTGPISVSGPWELLPNTGPFGQHLAFSVTTQTTVGSMVYDVTSSDPNFQTFGLPTNWNDMTHLDWTNYMNLSGTSVTTLTIHISTQFANQFADQRYWNHLRVQGLKLRVILKNACTYNVLNDGGMEDWPTMIYWGLTHTDQKNGRLNIGNLGGQLSGVPACGKGWQGMGAGIGSNVYSDIEQPFYWDGVGTAYWKFRFESTTALFNMAIIRTAAGMPLVYLTDASGNIIDLFGSTDPNASGYFSQGWALVRGSIPDLPQGHYTFHLAHGFNSSTNNGVWYDDVGFGHAAFDDNCDEIIIDVPTDFPTPTPFATLTITATGLPSSTPAQTQLALTPTPRPSMSALPPSATVTPWGTPGNANGPYTSSPVPTDTDLPAELTATSQGTPIPSKTPRPTSTQNSNPGSTNGGDMPNQRVVRKWGWGWDWPWPLPQGVDWTFCAPWDGACWNPQGTQVAGVPGAATPIGGIPGSPGGPVIPGTGDPGEGTSYIYCYRPNNPWSLAAWLDYEVCTLMDYVAWGPNQSATAVALPNLFASKVPFNYAGDIVGGMHQMQTQVATVQWGNTGLPGMAAPVNPAPNEILTNTLGNSSNDPWGSAPQFTINLTVQNAGLSKYCSTQLSSLMAATLAEGMCYAVNTMMTIGYLPWIQVIINILSVWGIIRIVLKFFSPHPSTIDPGKLAS